MIPLDADSRFERAIQETAPSAALHELAIAFKNEGAGQKELYDYFMKHCVLHGEDEDETVYDAIADALDSIWGWGNSKYWIFGQHLSE